MSAICELRAPTRPACGPRRHILRDALGVRVGRAADRSPARGGRTSSGLQDIRTEGGAFRPVGGASCPPPRRVAPRPGPSVGRTPRASPTTPSPRASSCLYNASTWPSVSSASRRIAPGLGLMAVEPGPIASDAVAQAWTPGGQVADNILRLCNNSRRLLLRTPHGQHPDRCDNTYTCRQPRRGRNNPPARNTGTRRVPSADNSRPVCSGREPVPGPSRAGDQQVGSHGQSPYNINQLPKRLTLLPCVTRPPDRQRDGPASGDAQGVLEAGQGGADDRGARGGAGGLIGRFRLEYVSLFSRILPASCRTSLTSQQEGWPVRPGPDGVGARCQSFFKASSSSLCTPNLHGGHEWWL